MRRRWLLSLAALPAVFVLSSAVAAREPVVWSASQHGGHVIVSYSLGDLAPGDLVVATSTRRNRVGELVDGVKLRERLPLSRSLHRLQWRSRRALRHGVYFVQVSGIQADGVADCTPPLLGCGQRWSNVRRIVVP
jgi:hypothetical protein